MEVDHFQPKGKRRHHYSNFLPATRHCNGAKSQTWPTAADWRAGIRFLDPTVEQDYGVHMFEDPITHHLVGATPAGRFQILICDLNAPHLVRERRDRAEIATALAQSALPMIVGAPFAEVARSLQALKEELALKIPPIPPPPSG